MGKAREEEATWIFGGTAFQAEGIAHAKALGQTSAWRSPEQKMERQEGATANGIRVVFFKVILVTVRLHGGQEWKPRHQAPGSFQ